jgi:hypothetical protein
VTDKACNDLKAATSNTHSAKDFNLARDRGEERRWLYADNWKEWPDKISIKVTSGVDSIASDHDILGDYRRHAVKLPTNRHCGSERFQQMRLQCTFSSSQTCIALALTKSSFHCRITTRTTCLIWLCCHVIGNPAMHL